MFVYIIAVVLVTLLVLLSSSSSKKTDARLSLLKDFSPRLLICSTGHSRFFPVRHSFKYPLLYIFCPLDSSSSLFFAIDKWRIFHIRTADYLGHPQCGPSLTEKLRWHLQQHVRPHVTNLGNIYVQFNESVYLDDATIPRIRVQPAHDVLHL